MLLSLHARTLILRVLELREIKESGYLLQTEYRTKYNQPTEIDDSLTTALQSQSRTTAMFVIVEDLASTAVTRPRTT